MAENKSDLIKNIMINVGILLILVSTTGSKDLGPAYFFLGLILLAIQTLDLKGVELRKLVTAELIIAGALLIAGTVQLIMSRFFGASQVFMIFLLIGALLVVIETVRKYADL